MEKQAAAVVAGPICTHGAIRRASICLDRILFIKQDDDDTERADQQSVQYLVNHLHSDSVTELCLHKVRFSDEGFAVLLAYFASNTTAPLTRVQLLGCDFGPPDRASQLLAAIQTNNASSVTDLTVTFSHFQGETLENFTLDSDILAELLQNNNPPLERLCLNGFALRMDNTDALQQALGNIPHLTVEVTDPLWYQ